jgi:thiol-disulfide isomerase/thioredoxin
MTILRRNEKYHVNGIFHSDKLIRKNPNKKQFTMKLNSEKTSLYILLSIFLCCSCKHKDHAFIPVIESGIAKVTGKIINYPAKKGSLPVLQVNIPYPVTAEFKTYTEKMKEDGSFSFEIPLECNVVAGIGIDELPSNICLVPNEETLIEFTYIDDEQIKVNMKSSIGLTNEDMENINSVVTGIALGEINFGKSIPYNLQPDEFGKLYIANLDSLQKYIEQLPNLSVPAKNIISHAYKLIYLRQLLDYKKIARFYYSNQRENKDAIEEYIPIEPNKSYYALLKHFNLNDPMYLYGFYFEITEFIMRNDTLAIPPIENMPVNDWFKIVKTNISDLIGFDNGLFYDMLVANAYAMQMNDETKPLSNIQKDNIKKYFKNKSFVDILLKKSDEIEKTAGITAHLKINETPSIPEKELTANQKGKIPQGELVDSIVSKYKGKIVVIDFWATWCSPCMQAMAESRELKQEMLNKNVVFVYITNRSSPRKLWEKKIIGIGGEHYYLNGEEWESISFSEKYGFDGIPTYLIFDENGTLKNKFTVYSGNDKMRKIIEGLLPPEGQLGDDGDANATAKPCPPPHRGCNGPHGTWVSGELCCLLPCNGIFSTYGYALLSGFSKCPW